MKNKSKVQKIAKRLLLTILGLIIIFFLWFLFYEGKYSGLQEPWDETLIISHRGFGNHAPDNSLAGAKLSIENNMDGIDVDGQLSKDGELVIFHDLSVDRLTDSTGRVGSKTLDELKELDLGPYFSESFTGSYVTTFEEFLTTMQGNGIFMVELKVPSTKETGIEKRAAEIIQKHNAHDFVLLSSFNPIVLHRLKKIDPEIRTVLIFMDTNWNPELLKEIKPGDEVNLPWILRQEPIRRGIRKLINPDYLSVNIEVDEKTIDAVMDLGYPIFLWTPNQEDLILKALNKKPFGVITDEPILTKSLK